MKSIKITVAQSGHEVFLPMYFANSHDLKETEQNLLRSAPWGDAGVFKMTVSEGRIYYTDTIGRAAHRIILDHVRLWKEAEKLAEMKLGKMAWLMENKTFKRAATVRQLAAAKELMISEVAI